MASISLRNLCKTYPNGQCAASDLSLEIDDGELLVLVGPSGCGKSTALRLVAGLEVPDGGSIWIGGENVTGKPPELRDLAMVFQSYALYPHRSVAENLGFGLRMAGMPRDRIRERVESVARRLGIADLLDRRPSQLSGGQRQRVALGRAIAREPKAFLLDEPLSNLDAKLRSDTRAEISRLHRQLGATMLYVTHDQEEAMTLGDRIAVMRDGRVEQVGEPLDVYRKPQNAFVAEFVGAPTINLISCERVEEGGCTWLRGAGLQVPAPSHLPEMRAVTLGIRPESLALTAVEDADLVGRVDVVEPLGNATLLHVELGEDGCLRVLAADFPRDRTGEEVGLQLDRGALHFFDSENGLRIRAA
jgi:multiple sugar transport system ATP-binding protein